MSDQQGYWLCPNCGEVPGEQVTYEEYHNICGSKVTEMVRTPPTTEEVELWKEKIQDIIRKNIKTCILDGGEMKKPEEKIGIMGEYNAATEILELLRLRSEQKSEVIELTKEKVTELVTLAYKEGFSRNGRPLGEWGDHYNENEAELKEYIDQLFKQNP